MVTKYGLPMYYGANAKLFEFAKAMRDKPTSTEEAMWQILKTRVVPGYKFRRQHPIATFIADFYCHELRLVIEVDGGYHLHQDQIGYDNFRDEDMAAMNIVVLRFTDKEVISNTDLIVEKVNHSFQQIKLTSL